MWKPEILGTEIATRRLLFRPKRGRRREVVVKIGQPTRSPNPVRSDPWWCPFEVVGLGQRKFSAAAGEDSVQALVLALRGIEVWLLSQAKRAGGKLDWLGELERPMFAHTFFTEAYAAAIANLVEGLQLACELIERPGGSIRYDQQTERLRELVNARGFEKREKRRRKRKASRAG